MPVVLYRIDNRLIHAQILESWLPFTRATAVAVVNDEFRRDDFRQQIIVRSVSSSVPIIFLSLKEALQRLEQFTSAPNSQVIVLFASPQDLLMFIEGGGRAPKEVNVGGMHYAIVKVGLGRYRSFSEEDRTALMKLQQMGISLDARATPVDEPVDLLPILKGV